MINQCYHKEDIFAKILYWFLKGFLILDFKASFPFSSSINRSHIPISSFITAWTCHSSSSPTSLLHRVTISLSTLCPVFAKCPMTWERKMTKIRMLPEVGRTRGMKMERDVEWDLTLKVATFSCYDTCLPSTTGYCEESDIRYTDNLTLWCLYLN